MTETPEFDHLLHCVPDVDKAVDAYRDAGLPAHANRPFDGFHNGAWRLDERYIEILTIVDHQRYARSAFGEATTAWLPEIDRLIAEGGGAMNFAVNVADVDATARRLRGQGHGVEVTDFRLDGSPVGFREAILTDAPPWAPFFITYDPPRTELVQSFAADRVNRGTHDLRGFVIATPNPVEAAIWLGEVIGLPCRDDASIVPLPGASVQFVPGAADHITALLLADGNPPTTTVAGLELRPAPTNR
ncbi:MAG: VOC family protein [Stackebrandtia sp.]